MFCANCGTKNDDANRFCSHCGHALTSPQASQSPSAQTGTPVHPPNAPTHSSASWLGNLPPYLGLVFAALGGGMVGLVLLAVIVSVVPKPNPSSIDITTAAVLATPTLSQTPIAGPASPTIEVVAQSPLLPSPTPSPLPTRVPSPTAVPPTPTLRPFTGNPLETIILPPELIKAVEAALAQRWKGGGRAVRNVTAERKAADQDGLTGQAFFEMQNAVIGTSPIWIKFSTDFKATRTAQGQWGVNLAPFVSMIDYVSGGAFQVVPNLDPEITQAVERSVITAMTPQDMSVRNIRIQRSSGDETSVRVRVTFGHRDAMGSNAGWIDNLQWEFEAKKQNGSWDVKWLRR